MIDEGQAPGAEGESVEETSKEQQPKKKGSFWKELPILLGVAILVAIVVRTWVVQTYYIPSGSMENTLLVNDRVLVNKLVYDFSEPERGEIIVFTAPESWRSVMEEDEFIKRVIAVGGDHIVADEEGDITVNGEPLDEESYLYTNPMTGEQDRSSQDPFDVVVPEGRLWVMGDHRSASGDSRERYVRTGGDVESSTIPVDAVIGKAFVLFWPVDDFTWFKIPETFDDVPAPS
ncbi:signal peptidase I [Glycomyces niveus]|uniref:signal peptidase I n=1 Tax=Glycomyces niveus TaxID=2820287 RepID=UPI0027DD7312|nr:signal peptidase I [Glycomyces sp. NEAU-S30]